MRHHLGTVGPGTMPEALGQRLGCSRPLSPIASATVGPGIRMFKTDCEDDQSWEKLTKFPHVATTEEALATVDRISFGNG